MILRDLGDKPTGTVQEKGVKTEYLAGLELSDLTRLQNELL
jgi:hypothetical protein